MAAAAAFSQDGDALLLLLVPSLPAADGTINHRRLSVNAKRKEGEIEKERKVKGEREDRGCERRSKVKRRGFPAVYMRVANLCRTFWRI